MPLPVSTPAAVIIGLSWLLSCYCLVRLWRSDEYLVLKVLLSVLLTAPLFGPFIYFWTRNIPPAMHPDLMDQRPRQLDVLNRWRTRLEEAGRLPKLQQMGRRRKHPKSGS
jgi:hypothetical protein